jgi:hypothetical protein
MGVGGIETSSCWMMDELNTESKVFSIKKINNNNKNKAYLIKIYNHINL